MSDKSPIPITAQQYQLLSSPIRLRILHILADKPKTAKQVADEMGETRGNVHYHIQRLVNGGIVELVQTRQAGTIIEKYYRSRGTQFTQGDPSDHQAGRYSTITWQSLSLDEAEDLVRQVSVVLQAWQRRHPENDAVRHDYQVAFRLIPATETRNDPL